MIRYVLIFTSCLLVLAQERGEIDLTSFRDQMLQCHNKYRSLHGANALRTSDLLNQYAQNYAQTLAALDSGLIQSGGPYGENLHWSVGKVEASAAASHWYDENRCYDYNCENPPNFAQVGHFTQMVWKDSLVLGVGAATGASGRTYVVCSYSPPGNIGGLYKQNVLPPSG